MLSVADTVDGLGGRTIAEATVVAVSKEALDEALDEVEGLLPFSHEPFFFYGSPFLPKDLIRTY